MVENGVRGETCHAVCWYAKANNKCMKDYDKNKESSYHLHTGMQIIYMHRQCHEICL